MKRTTQQLFSGGIGVIVPRFDPLKNLMQRFLQAEVTQSQMPNQKFSIVTLEETFKAANSQFDSIASNSNLPKGEALKAAKAYFAAVKSMINGIAEVGYDRLSESECVILSKACSSLARFQYKTGSSQERENIKKIIELALTLDPNNSEAEDYRLELGINYARQDPQK